jgi:HEAT repeat protein
LVRSERAPIPGPLDSGKYPCQALRYYLALDGVVSEAALAPDEKVARVLPFLSYEAEPDEGKSFGTDSYSGLHQKAVAVLGNIDSEAAFRSLVDLVKGEALRSHAAEAQAKHRSRDALPHLLTALEAEDLAEPRRNRQQISARIVSAMFEHSPSKAAPLVRQFLDAKQRRYASAIEGAFGRAQEKSQ